MKLRHRRNLVKIPRRPRMGVEGSNDAMTRTAGAGGSVLRDNGNKANAKITRRGGISYLPSPRVSTHS
jgi:hypothetical protein